MNLACGAIEMIPDVPYDDYDDDFEDLEDEAEAPPPDALDAADWDAYAESLVAWLGYQVEHGVQLPWQWFAPDGHDDWYQLEVGSWSLRVFYERLQVVDANTDALIAQSSASYAHRSLYRAVGDSHTAGTVRQRTDFFSGLKRLVKEAPTREVDL